VRDTKLELGKPSPRRSRKAIYLGWATAAIARLLHRRPPEPTVADLNKHDYPTSTQRMGVRFSERIRDTFRFRWLRQSNKDE